jgi:hypothetical protein
MDLKTPDRGIHRTEGKLQGEKVPEKKSAVDEQRNGKEFH